MQKLLEKQTLLNIGSLIYLNNIHLKIIVMLNFLLTLLVALLIGGIIVGLCFWLINILIYLFGGGDIGTIHSGTHKFLN
jgi:hypothetical protein